MRKDAKAYLRNIIFDWGGVMCSAGDHFCHPAIQKYSGLPLEEVRKKANNIMIQYYTGKISGDLFWAKLITLAKLKPLTPHDLKTAYFNSYNIYPEMFEIVKVLRESFKIGLLSNLTLDMALYIKKKHKLDNFFDYSTFSYETGSIKPATLMYKNILKQMNAKPEETLFIDDSKINIEKAKILGMRGILFYSVPQFKSELKCLLIKKSLRKGGK